jgi:hypothetical protein
MAENLLITRIIISFVRKTSFHGGSTTDIQGVSSRTFSMQFSRRMRLAGHVARMGGEDECM